MTVIDEGLSSIAGAQHGLLTTAQADAVGASRVQLAALVKAGVLTHPCRGLYAVTETVPADPAARHTQLAAGAHLLYDDAVLSGVSAVLAHGVVEWGTDLRRPRLQRPIDRAVGVMAFHIRPVTAAGRAPVETAFGPAVSLADALVQHAIDDGMAQGVVSADDALHRRLVSLADLDAAVSQVGSWPHSSRARGMLAWADGSAESVGESRCRVVLGAHGIRLIPQVTITDDWGAVVARVDFLVEGTNVVVEFDGKVKYAAGDAEVLWAEKRREDRLRRLGYVVVRITWADLERPGAVVAKVRRALRAA